MNEYERDLIILEGGDEIEPSPQLLEPTRFRRKLVAINPYVDNGSTSSHGIEIYTRHYGPRPNAIDFAMRGAVVSGSNSNNTVYLTMRKQAIDDLIVALTYAKGLIEGGDTEDE